MVSKNWEFMGNVSSSAKSPADIVREVYQAFNSCDPRIIEEAARDHFSSQIVVREAESLPWDGVYEGIETVAEMTKGISAPDSPIDAAQLKTEHLFTSSDDTVTNVLTSVSLPWRGSAETIPMRAIE
ncbi:MAG: hypothetical protein EOO27_06095 [Comamonadaceae bacterium]|nr:MAG: hypothetical protein EOO27_06095 [Comamonadaceae bacterium]